MFVMTGTPFLSDFNRQKLTHDLRHLGVTDIIDSQVFVFDDTPDDDTRAIAKSLLNADDNAPSADIYITPRIGTISPWSSKAQDIFMHCGKRVRVERVLAYRVIGDVDMAALLPHLHDKMTQSALLNLDECARLFKDDTPAPITHIDARDKNALTVANDTHGFGLSGAEIDYLVDAYTKMNKDASDAELMMFAQANSEHCRHKIFNANFTIDGQKTDKSLFGMIKNTYEKNKGRVVSAYHDNAAIMMGARAPRFFAKNGQYGFVNGNIDILMKVETHNHPTAIAPFEGAATGVGGEIRDEGATGRGGKPKAGLAGYSVSHLLLDEVREDWELDIGKPNHMASAQKIMTDAPLGAAAFSNEFGRPTLAGYFRVFLQKDAQNEYYGYHKPIMIAGGYGNIDRAIGHKNPIKDGDLLIVLGGPAMQIGLGGGAASSVDSGTGDSELDFASVQRDNAEMQRRAQEVIDACWALDDNPIISIHDVGAGGLSNAMPELVGDHDLGAVIDLRQIPSIERAMSPMAVWSNEAQERYVLAISPHDLPRFSHICARERCPFAVIGTATNARHLWVKDPLLAQDVVDMPMSVLLGGLPKIDKIGKTRAVDSADITLDFDKDTLTRHIYTVLRHPSVASKSFLISINDRSVGGMVARDQYVGRYQVPVADCAVTASCLHPMTVMTGEVMAMGERAPIAVLDPAASARMSVGEAITNICAASIDKIGDISLSANWMNACGDEIHDGDLYQAVKAIGMDLCPDLGINIPVGKDSLSMRTAWDDNSVRAPLSVVISAFAPVVDVKKTLTPNLCQIANLYHIALNDKARLGGSILAQCLNLIGTPADVDDAGALVAFFNAVQSLNQKGLLHAYHDVSDGGLIATISEMLFCDRMGADITLDSAERLFCEELGAVIAVLPQHEAEFLATLDSTALMCQKIGTSTRTDTLNLQIGDTTLSLPRADLQREWTRVSHAITRVRDNAALCDDAFALIDDPKAALVYAPTFAVDFDVKVHGTRPKVAILREQGVNGHVEMAAGFWRAGFDAIDVHMSDLIAGRYDLRDFVGVVACGGFSYGDVLGAGAGWAKSVLFNPKLAQMFRQFFHDTQKFALGVCNGCQMMAQLKDLMPNAAHFGAFKHNLSGRFEARTVNVRIDDSPSILLNGMAGSILPIAIAHGEGLYVGNAPSDLVAMRYVDAFGAPSEHYPLNPNGSKDGITALTTPDGRITIMMPHPERTLLAHNHSWHDGAHDNGAWFKLFANARDFVK